MKLEKESTSNLQDNFDYHSEVAESFGRASSNYEEFAAIQQQTASRLIATLKPWRSIIPEGKVLEIGCGTGFVTNKLVELFPDREFLITDIAPEMINKCREQINEDSNITFKTLDVEDEELPDREYGLIVGGFVAQWFKHPAVTLGRLLKSVKNGGLLLVSFPGDNSFPEWKDHCESLGIPFTGNKLPNTEEMIVKLSTGPVQVDYYEDDVVQKFDRSLDFFRHLKKIGAGTQKCGRSLTAKEFRLLIDHWDSQSQDEITVTYHIVFIAIKRNFEI